MTPPEGRSPTCTNLTITPLTRLGIMSVDRSLLFQSPEFLSSSYAPAYFFPTEISISLKFKVLSSRCCRGSLRNYTMLWYDVFACFTSLQCRHLIRSKPIPFFNQRTSIPSGECIGIWCFFCFLGTGFTDPVTELPTTNCLKFIKL